MNNIELIVGSIAVQIQRVVNEMNVDWDGLYQAFSKVKA